MVQLLKKEVSCPVAHMISQRFQDNAVLTSHGTRLTHQPTTGVLRICGGNLAERNTTMFNTGNRKTVQIQTKKDKKEVSCPVAHMMSQTFDRAPRSGYPLMLILSERYLA